MYYLVVIQTCGEVRNTITIAGKNIFGDLYDNHKLMIPRCEIMSDEEFEEIIADGYSTVEEAMNAEYMKKTLADYIGCLYDQEYWLIADDELRIFYEMVKEVCDVVVA